MSSTVTGSLPPEGHHGGHLGGQGGGASGFWRGKAPVSPQPSWLVPRSMSLSREGRGTWLPDPEATLSSPQVLITAALEPGLVLHEGYSFGGG